MSRRLDASVAEALGKKIVWRWMEWIVGPDSPGPGICSNYAFRESEDYVEGATPVVLGEGGDAIVLEYSSDGNAMLELIGEMKEREWEPSMEHHEKEFGFEYFKNGWSVSGYAETLPLAVALAAYKALTGKEWAE